MSDKARRPVEWLKTGLIVLLTCSAFYLVGRTQVYSNLTQSAAGGWIAPILAFFDRGAGGLAGNVQAGTYTPQPETARPVRVVITNEDGSYGVQYSAGVDAVFDSVGSLLAEAVGAARAPRVVGEANWQRALRAPGVYFDFLGKIPLAALPQWLSVAPDTGFSGGAVRRLCMAVVDGAAALYYINEIDGLYYACEISADLSEHLAQAISSQVPNGALYAFRSDGAYESLYPYTLILPEPPRAQVFAASMPLGDISADTLGEPLDALLRELSFHPQVNSIYSAIDGDGLVVREGNDIVRVTASGELTYSADAGGVARFPVAAPGGEVEVLGLTRELAERTVGTLCGSARLYLMDVERTQTGYIVRFGYVLGGAAVQLYDEGLAARFEIEGDRITAFALCFRSYAPTGGTSLILPEIQAAAAVSALGGKGGELLLRYEDTGQPTLSASWGV